MPQTEPARGEDQVNVSERDGIPLEYAPSPPRWSEGPLTAEHRPDILATPNGRSGREARGQLPLGTTALLKNPPQNHRDNERIFMGQFWLLLKLLRRHELRGTNEAIANRLQSENARPLNDEETGHDLMQQRLASNRSAIS